MSAKHVDKIVETYRTRTEEDRYSRCVKLQEIKENDFNLNITRYVSLAQKEEQIDLEKNAESLAEIESRLSTAKTKLNIYLRELGLKEI